MSTEENRPLVIYLSRDQIEDVERWAHAHGMTMEQFVWHCLALVIEGDS